MSRLRSPVLVAALAVTSLCASPAAAQTSTSSDRAARFDAADRQAQAALWTIECAQASAGGRATGAYGPADSVGAYGFCISVGGTRHGVFADADSALTRITNVRMVNFGTRQRSTAAIDTAALLAELRAKRAAMRAAAPAFLGEGRQFYPLSLRRESGEVLVWLLPATLLQGRALGGERWWRFAPDGATVLDSADARSRWRAWTMPATREVTIASDEPDIPLVSELLIANLLARSGRIPTIETGTYASTLTGDMWLQVKRSP